MKLHYFSDNDGNFGDALNPWFWSQVIPGLLDDDEQQRLLGIGTLINHRLPPADYWVFGSGAGYGELPKGYQQWRVYCVRGPLTAQQLGLPTELAVTDPAALCPRLYQPVATATRYPVSFIPHYMSAKCGAWATVCAAAGVHYIDPRDPPLQVIEQIVHSERVISQAMHGAILADAYRVPWQAASVDGALEPKWQDWLLSLGLQGCPLVELQQVWLGDAAAPLGQRLKNRVKRALLPRKPAALNWTPPIPAKSPPQHHARQAELLAAAAGNERFILSAEALLSRQQDRLEALLQQLRDDLTTRPQQGLG